MCSFIHNWIVDCGTSEHDPDANFWNRSMALQWRLKLHLQFLLTPLESGLDSNALFCWGRNLLKKKTNILVHQWTCLVCNFLLIPNPTALFWGQNAPNVPYLDIRHSDHPGGY